LNRKVRVGIGKQESSGRGGLSFHETRGTKPGYWKSHIDQAWGCHVAHQIQRDDTHRDGLGNHDRIRRGPWSEGRRRGPTDHQSDSRPAGQTLAGGNHVRE